MAGAGEDVDQVPQLRTTITQREFANRVNYNDPAELSCSDLKTHDAKLAGLRFFPAESYLAWPWLSTRLHSPEPRSMSEMAIFGHSRPAV